ncbi:MAG: sulfatase family protein [Candidatus Cyclobacteriaceae bacterium M3_2C_046]
MKTISNLIILLSVFMVGCNSPQQIASDNDLPNVVLILSDDQGWTDYGFMGHPHIKTPHIDKLARQSLTFTYGYVTAPLCRPSLASIATGLYPHQNGITGNDPDFAFDGKSYSKEWLEKRGEFNRPLLEKFQQHPTIGQMLKDKGYISFQSGKWWEGNYQNGGFTHGMTQGDSKRGGRHGDSGLDIGREGMEPVFSFMDSAISVQHPFFVWYAPFLPHTPHNPPDSLLQDYLHKAPNEKEAKYWAMIEWFDHTVGQLLNHLEDKEVANNTLVVYVCDNGWITNTSGSGPRYAPRSKRSPYEMGIRTPIIYRWPGKIKPEIDTINFVSTTDIVPTILAAAGLSPTREMLGINAMNQAANESREAVFCEDFEHDLLDINDPSASLQHLVIMQRPWKLIVPYNDQEGSVELFNAVKDKHEQNNLAEEMPEMVEQLKNSLDSFWQPEKKI